MPSSRYRTLSAFAATAVVGAGLTVFGAPAAQAAPVFTDAETHLDPYANVSSYDQVGGSSDCTDTAVGGGEPNVPVVENGPAATASTSVNGTFANAADPADTASFAGSITATGKVASAGGTLTSMDFSSQGTAQLNNPAAATSKCYRYGYAGMELDFRFTVGQAGFLHIDMANRGGGYGEVYLFLDSGTGSSPYYENYGRGLKFNSKADVYLPAGTYDGYFLGEVQQNKVSGTVTASTTVHAEFDVAGSQTRAVSGKGKKYVTLPAARACASDALIPSITDKKKRAAKIKKVAFFVNDAKVKTVKTPDKGDTVTLPVADDVAAELRAEVTLFPKKEGKPAKTYEVSAAYEACS